MTTCGENDWSTTKGKKRGNNNSLQDSKPTLITAVKTPKHLKIGRGEKQRESKWITYTEVLYAENCRTRKLNR